MDNPSIKALLMGKQQDGAGLSPLTQLTKNKTKNNTNKNKRLTPKPIKPPLTIKSIKSAPKPQKPSIKLTTTTKITQKPIQKPSVKKTINKTVSKPKK